jgi:hypothetical protein
MAAILRAFVAPVRIGPRSLPPLGLVILAAIGAVFLAVIAATSWRDFNDEHAYWLAASRLAAGESLYDATAAPNTPFAYWYPPPLAQILAPLIGILSADAFSIAWTALLLVCLWWLAGRDVLVALALIAFLPVAVELRVRNVHLLLAVLLVLALRRSWLFWIPAAAIKVAPALGVLYLAAARRLREAALVALAGAAVLAVSLVLSPGAWSDFIAVVGPRANTDGGSLMPIPFAIRFLAGAALAALGGWAGGRRGEALLVIGITLANPTLWATALSLLVALLPLWRSAPGEAGDGGSPLGADGAVKQAVSAA